MKNQKFKLIALFALVLIAASCKKEEETDNPNINHRIISLEMKVSSNNAFSEMEIDVNDDGMSDFEIELNLYKDSEDDFEYEVRLENSEYENEYLGKEYDRDEYVKNLAKNDLISGGSSTWYQYCFLSLNEKSPSSSEVNNGFAGKGDVLVGIRFLIGKKLHYGWMKVNASADYKNVIVKEVAYDIRPDVEVRAGEK